MIPVFWHPSPKSEGKIKQNEKMNQVNGTPAHVADTPAANPATFGPVAGVSRDRDGRVFDAAKFLPEKDRNGRWLRIGGPAKRGRPPGSRNVAAPAESKPAAAEPPPADFSDVEKLVSSSEVEKTAEAGDNSPQSEPGGLPMPKDDYDRAAVATVSGIATVGIVAMGAHVAPKPDEIAAMVKAYADCYRAYGYAPESPPWLGPVIATAVWMGPHLSDERSQSKLQGWKIRLATIWAKLRGRRDARAAAQVAAEAGA